jgi:hypothetical protein
MQALLSFDQSPPFGAPLRFFLTAPLFAILAGFLLLWGGPDALASRWTPVVLALTHLIAAGFMLQVMLGAMLQIMPVVAGANLAHPLRVARIVHGAITLGALLLAGAFLSFWPPLFKLAAIFLGGGVVFFVVAAARSLRGMVAAGPTIQGLRHALAGLSITLALGLLMTASLGWSLDLPLMLLADIHLAWGFVAWGTVLLAAVGYVVVPMFQITPAYPGWFDRRFSLSVLVAVSWWTIAEWMDWGLAALWLGGAVVALAALFAGITLNIQRRTKRARLDATQYFWRLAMLSALAACALWLLAQSVDAVGQWPAWPLLCGVLVLFGAFMSVIVGMLYKIVPFLVWLHLQNQGQGRLAAPNMKKVIVEQAMNRQLLAHSVSCALMMVSVVWPLGVYPAGIALIVANAWLLRNLLSALSVHREHLLKIERAVVAVAPP